MITSGEELYVSEEPTTGIDPLEEAGACDLFG